MAQMSLLTGEEQRPRRACTGEEQRPRCRWRACRRRLVGGGKERVAPTSRTLMGSKELVRSFFFKWVPFNCHGKEDYFVYLHVNMPSTVFFFPFRLLLLLIFFTVQIFMFLVHHSLKNAVVPIRLVPDLYFLKPGDQPDKYRTSLLLQNSTGESVWRFVSVCLSAWGEG